MSRVADLPSRSPFSTAGDTPSAQRHLPLLNSSLRSSDSTRDDQMDITPTVSAPVPPTPNSHDGDSAMHISNGPSDGANASNTSTAGPGQTLGAATAAQQPKVVQTAFIHKLYNMLEDTNIQHLISWSNSNESFVMSPTSEFSKVLSQYFKHTNISSFVRQLNMYGFHKVSDVFHTGSPDSALWEFKHGNGNFKRGDLVGLREIKRRASRHTLIHRDSFSSNKPGPSQPGTPAEPIHDAGDLRFMNLEHSMFDMQSRMARWEENQFLLSSRCQALAESLVKCYQWTNSISQALVSMTPDRDSPLYRDVSNMQREIERQLDTVRGLETPHESLLSSRQQPFYANVTGEAGPPLSPRQMPQDDSRRPSLADVSKSNSIRAPVPQHLAVSPRRYGSIGAGHASPGYRPPPPPQQPPVPHPLSSVSSPPGSNLTRRHTSADIRQHGWPPTGVSPFANASGNSSGPWPSSPHRAPISSEQQVRDVLAQYEISGPRRRTDIPRHATPPLGGEPLPLSSHLNVDSTWPGGGPKFPHNNSSLPATRRSSMASNVHSLLNPTDTAERPEEEDSLSEDRKRKRIQ